MNRAMVTEDYQLGWREMVYRAILAGKSTRHKRKVFMIKTPRGWFAQSLPIPSPIGRSSDR